MHGRPARDRLAIWADAEHGEEIPCGDPSVTDAERAAAGRETLTERAGLPCRYQEWIGGHDGSWWDQQLPPALAWLLAPSPGA
jgi:enterochelin esterase-like enzyme